MGTTPSLLFRKLLPEVPRGTPLTTQWLSEKGLAAQQVARLAESGWLTRLGHGIYLLPGDQLNREAALARLVAEMPGLHVAGKSALSWRGVRHNLAHTLAEELDLPWKSLARAASGRLGGGSRWVAKTRTGERLNLKRPT